MAGVSAWQPQSLVIQARVVMSSALNMHTAPQIHFERVMGLQPYWVQGSTHTNPLFLPLPPSLTLSSYPSLHLSRALYERIVEAELDLSFKKDDILYVDDTLPKGSFGTWMAWQLDENAQQIQRGQIPSKYM